MEVQKLFWMVTATLYFILAPVNKACMWSNEECAENHECCSNMCEQGHPGTHPRCEKSRMGQPCFYNYHCERAQICGPKNRCCADYWKDCRDRADCCDSRHVCIHARGFVYKKCLYGPLKSKNRADPVKGEIPSYALFVFMILEYILS